MAAFLLGVGALGQLGAGTAARLLFITGSVAIAWHAYRRGGLASHVEMVIPLFVLGPLLRRIIDLHSAYDPTGVMLIGPLLALVVVLPELRTLLSARSRPLADFLPLILIIGCVGYGWAISSFQNNVVESSAVAVKYVIPVLYCMVLMVRSDQSDNVLAAAARAFLLLGPVIGIYGIAQHLAPQAWDQFWMVASKIPSIGQPFPGQVRVFGTMNSPVSFAAYATFGLLLFGFMPRSFVPPILVPLVAILPLGIAILLTSVRTAWISASVSLLFCLLFRRTRGRATLMIVCLSFAAVFAVSFTSFGDVIASRFATLDGNVAGDGSGSERLGDYFHVFSEDSRYIFGTGLAPVDGDTKLSALDGQILMAGVQMGTVFGVLYVVGMVWAGVRAVLQVRGSADPLRLVAAALVVGNLAVIPLTAVGIGEIGFLFWMAVGALSSARNAVPATRARRVRPLRPPLLFPTR